MTITGISSNTVSAVPNGALTLENVGGGVIRSKRCDVTPFGEKGRTFTFENACGSVLKLTLSKYISE